MTIKRITRLITLVACIVAAASSCSREEAGSDGTSGYLDVHAAKNADLVEVFTKADEESDVIALTVYDSDSNAELTAEDITTVDWPVTILSGSYTAVATSGSDGLTARFDEPFYSATEEFTINHDKVTTLALTLTLDAVMATVKFTEDFDTYFTSYTFTVSNGKNELVFSKAEDGTEGTLNSEGYFAVTGTLNYVLTLVNTQGQTYYIEDTFTDVEAKQHYAFSFSVEEKPTKTPGLGVLEIIMDTSMNDVTHSFSFTLTDNPEILESSTYDPSEALSMYVGNSDSKVVDIDLKTEAVSVIIRHSDTGLATAGVPTSTELVDADAETIATLYSAGITASSISTIDTETSIDFTTLFSKLSVGTYAFEIYAENAGGGTKTFTANVEILEVPDATAAVSADPWAMFATLTGRWTTDEVPSELGFQYRATGDTDWIDVTSTITTDEAAGTFTTELRGLEPETEYEFRTVSADDSDTVPVTFTTESAGSVTNMNFDSWYDVGKYMSPNASDDEDAWTWDSANPGTATISIYPTSQETSHVVSGSAARLESMYTKYLSLIDVFAAGNIYTGQFVKAVISSSMGAQLNWGVKFSSRPLALTGYFDYSPVEIDHSTDTYADKAGTMDVGQIQVILTDWTEQFPVNTAEGNFVDTSESNTDIIAYGNLDITADSNGEYQSFTLKLDYRDTTRIPTYIVIVAASSKYGDYFTGGAGSVLYVDEFSFVYDPDELDTQLGE